MASVKNFKTTNKMLRYIEQHISTREREGTINVIDQGSGILHVIAVPFQERVITQPWYTYGMQDFRPPQKISLFYIWLIKAEFEWTGQSVEKEGLEKHKLNSKRILEKTEDRFQKV